MNRSACFADDNDRTLYLGLLQESLPETACRLHAYVLMTNHVHLLITPDGDDAASHLMKSVAQRYAQRCNKRWRRTGPFWEGPFKSSLVDSQEYALNCHRYIEENPLRAGIVRDPAEYPWSSYRANALGWPCPFLSPHRSMESLSADPVERQGAYRALFDTPQPEKELALIREGLKSSLATGSAEFIERIATASGRRATRRNRWTAAA